MPYKDPVREREYQREYQRHWRSLHPEESKAKSKGEYYRHREDRIERSIKYSREHPEKKKLNGQRHYQRYCEEIKAKTRQYREANKDKVLENKRAYQKTPLGKKTHHKACRSYRRKLKLRLVALLGGKCAGCGETDPRLLQVNHKNGGGKQEYDRYNDSWKFYLDIVFGRRSIADLDLRCANCNILYEYEVGRRVW